MDAIWKLYFPGNTEKDIQSLYFSERPSCSFSYKDLKTGKKVYNEKPIYNNIIIEMPTRILPCTRDWIVSKSSINLFLALEQNNKVFEKYYLENINVLLCEKAKSIVIDLEILRIVSKYRFFRRM